MLLLAKGKTVLFALLKIKGVATLLSMLINIGWCMLAVLFSLFYLSAIHYHWGTAFKIAEPEDYCHLPMRQRLTVGAVYVALAAVLSGALFWIHQINAFKAAH